MNDPNRPVLRIEHVDKVKSMRRLQENIEFTSLQDIIELQELVTTFTQKLSKEDKQLADYCSYVKSELKDAQGRLEHLREEFVDVVENYIEENYSLEDIFTPKEHVKPQ